MNKFLRLVAWLEILAGVFMLLHLTYKFFSSNETGTVFLDKGWWFILLGALGLIAGVALLRSSMRAWLGSVLLQLLLLPVFVVEGIAYRPGVGLFLPLVVNIPEGAASPIFEFSLGVDYTVSHGMQRGQQYVGVNVAALACLVILMLNRPLAGKRVFK
jgi:hypothetical protein